jgi:hypothetical protein
VIVGAATFVIGEEECGILPFRTAHERIHYLRHLHLPVQHRRPRSRVLIIDAGARFDEAEAGESTVRKVGVVGSQRSNMVRVDAEVVRSIANHARRLSGAGASGMR